MDYSNQHIKQQLRQEMPLPEGFAWEDMEVGIVQTMEANTMSTTRSKWAWIWKISGGLVALSLIGVLSYYILQHSGVIFFESSNLEKNNTPIPATETEMKPAPLTNDCQLIADASSTQVIESEQENNTHHQQTANSISKSPERSFPSNASNAKTTLPSATVKNAISLSKTPNGQNKIAASLAKQTAISNTTPAHTAALERIPIFISKLSSRLALLNWQYPLSNTLIAENSSGNNKKKGYFALDLSTGINTWAARYAKDADLNAARAASERTLVGTSAGIGMTYHLPSAFFAQTGLQWQQLQSRFRYERMEVVAIEVEDAPVMNINLISNDTSQTYQNTIIDAAEIRNIQHYNQHQIWSIPILLGYQWQNGRTSLSLATGGLFSIKSRSTGRTLYDTDVIDYDRDAPIHAQTYGIAAVTQLRLQYHFDENLYFGGEISNTHWLKNWSVEEAIRFQPNSTNFAFVLGRKF